MSSTKIASVLQPFVDRHGLAGAVALVATKDKIVSLDTVGYADIAAKKPMQPDTLFWIASQTKPITGTGLMILVDEGKVSIEDPVEKYLPEFKGQMLIVEKDDDHVLLKKPAHPITVREVLNHTSGMAFASPIETPTFDMLPLKAAVRSHAALPLNFEPGSKYSYCNAGTNTAGRIIEVVSGLAYEDYMAERLFRPLGMADTTFVLSEGQTQRLTKVYKPNADKTDLEESTIGQLHYPLTDRARQPFPAGGLFSTARDCARFCQMVLSGGTFEGRRYMSEDAIRVMTRKHTAETITDSYGLGWAVGAEDFGHGGACATNMTIHHKRGLITVYLIQHQGFAHDGDKAHAAFKEAAGATG